MDLLKDFQRTRDVDKYVNYFHKNTKEIPELLAFSMNGQNGKLAEYGSWLSNHLYESVQKKSDPHSMKIKGHFLERIDVMIRVLKTESNQSILRNWLRMLLLIRPNADYDGLLLDVGLNFIENPKNKVALHAFSISLIAPIVKRQPELLDEILSILEYHKEGKSNAYHSSLKNFKKINRK